MSVRVTVDWIEALPNDSVFPSDSLYPSALSTVNDVTDRVLRGYGGMSLQYGRDQSTALAPTVAGRGSFVLNNRSKDYSPRNTSSPIYGYMKPARPVTITRTIGDELYASLSVLASPSLTVTDEETYVLFRGHTDDSPINPDIQNKTVSLSVVDWLADFRSQNITTPVYSGIRTGQAIHYVLDACGWPTELRNIDAGATAIPWWWADNKDAATALEELVRSEGPPALLTVGSDGSIIFKDRHHRLIDTPSLTSQDTWSGDPYDAEPLMSSYTYDEGWRNIINDCTVNVDVRAPQELGQVWNSDTTITLNGGEQRIITANTSDPFINAVVPEAGTDYTLLSGSVTVSIPRTSGASMPITLTAGGGGATIQGLQLRAQPVSTQYSIQVSASDSTSISDFGSRAYPSDLPWVNPYDAQAVLDLTVGQRAQPNPILEVKFVIGTDMGRGSPVLMRNLSDRVTVVEPETVINNDFYLENFQHDLNSEYDHTVTVGLEMVPTQPSPVAITDLVGVGADVGKTSGGFDNPANIAITDSTDSARAADYALTAT